MTIEPACWMKFLLALAWGPIALHIITLAASLAELPVA